MNGRGRPPVFLERRSYRRRRMMDARRILPVAGILLWLLPLFWPTGSAMPALTEKMMLSDAVIYLFSVWLILISAALVLWWALRPGTDAGNGAHARAEH